MSSKYLYPLLLGLLLSGLGCQLDLLHKKTASPKSTVAKPRKSPPKPPPPPKVGLYFEKGEFKLYGQKFIALKPSERELRDYETLIDCLRTTLGPKGPTTIPSGNKQAEGCQEVKRNKIMKPFFRLNYPTFNARSQIPPRVVIAYIFPGEVISELGLPPCNVGIIEYGHMDGLFYPLSFAGVIGFEERKKEVRSMTTIQKTPIRLAPLKITHPDKMPYQFNFAVYVLDVCYPGRLHSPPYRNMPSKK